MVVPQKADDMLAAQPYGRLMDTASRTRPDATTFSFPPPTGPAASTPTPRRWRNRLIALAILAAALALNRGGAVVIVVLFVLVAPFEKLFPRHRQRFRRPDLRTDIAYGIATPALAAATTVVSIVIGVASLAWLPGLALRPLVSVLPPAVQRVTAILLFDCTFYWLHRFSHEVPFLWRFHAVHHSTRQLDWASGLRNHPLDGALFAPVYVFLAAAGVHLAYVGLLAVVQIALGLFLHANVRWRLRPLHRVVITPEFHHWHHTIDARAAHSNYSVFLPIWDIVFGTYFMPADRRPEQYGIDEPMPNGMVPQLRYPLRGLPGPQRIVSFAVRHPVRGTRHLLRGVRRGLRQMWRSARRPTRRVLQSER